MCLLGRASGAALLMLFVLSSSLPAEIMTPEVKQVAERFACQCGSCNNQVSTCPMLNCGSATPLREEIASKLKQGMNEQQIVNAFIAKYGKVILPAPPPEGFDLVAWTLPFFALVAGFIFIYALIRTWLHRRVSVSAGAGPNGAIPETYQKQIERELKNLDL
ncbi:MAG: hypothetical protein DMG06_06950 [Acidobacteria bacterium]|nr:MAG: hypothetical protein DMG06_06950 [Acidobacteriota bacterium]